MMPIAALPEVFLFAPFGTVWHQVPSSTPGVAYRDAYDAFVIRMDGGKRYMKCVRVTGLERERGTGMVKVLDELHRCFFNGTAGMMLVEDEGELPLPETLTVGA